MANPFNDALKGQNSPNNSMLQRLAQMKKQGMSPNQALQQLFGGNVPQEVQIAINQMNSSGLTQQQYVTQIAKQNLGIDINEIMNFFK